MYIIPEANTTLIIELVKYFLFEQNKDCLWQLKNKQTENLEISLLLFIATVIVRLIKNKT